MDPAHPRVFADTAPSDPTASDAADRGRDSLFLLARMWVDGSARELRVRVRNLSAGGLMVELPEPVSPDSAVEIELRGLGRVTGRVAWQTEGRAGIAFDVPVDPQLARTPVGARPAESNRPLRFNC